MAYRADIEIAVRGAQELKRLQNELSATSKLIDGLNNYLENIGSGGVVRNINNLKTVVGDAAAAFDRVALNTDEAVIAARKYVTATNDLNMELRERAALLKTVNEEERKNKLASAGIRERTQYAGPIGPGPASPVGSLVGQTTPVTERIQRTIRARQDELDLQRALLRLEEKSAAELNKKVQSQQALVQGTREVVALLDQQAQRQKFLAGTSGTAMQGPLAGPGAMGFPVALPLSRAEQKALETESQKLRILERMATTRQQLNGLTANLQRLELNSVVAIANAERAQLKLNAAKAKELQLVQQTTTIRNKEATASAEARQRLAEDAARRRLMQDPALPPGMKGKDKGKGGLGFNPDPTGENLALGLGFPLLFGGGAGQAAGGLIGSFFGEGFGGQILGSAIGQILEDAQRRITEIGNALKLLNMDGLRDSVVFVNAELETTVRRLVEAGDAQTAQAIAADAVATQTGLLPQAVADISANANILGNIWNQFLGAVSGTLSIIGVPFVSALSLILSGFTKILTYTNLLITAVGGWAAALVKGVMSKFPWIARYYNHILNGAKAITEEEEKRNAALQAVIDKQGTEIRNNAANLALEKQRTLGRTTAEKLLNIELDKQLETNKIKQSYDEKTRAFLTEHKGASQELIDKEYTRLEALKSQELAQLNIKTRLQEQGIEIEANAQRYDRAAQAIQLQLTALETSNNVRQSQLSAESALNDLYGAQLERQYRLATTATQRYNIAIAQFNQQIRGAQLEYTQAILNNRLLVQKAELQARLVELKYREIAAEKQIAIAQAEARGNSAEQISKISAAYDLALGVQRDVVQSAYDQVTAAKQIAANQDLVARAIYQTKVVQAEGALAQKLTSEEIGMSKDQADRLAGALGVAAFQAVNTKDESSRLVGVIQAGTRQTQIFASAMSDVAAYARVAADDIGRAFRNQQLLNSARGASTTPKKKAADGAFWTGGFKAFAKGGVVNRPTLGLVGEGGESEYIVPESKAAGFATNYLFGSRGESAIPSEGSGAGAPPLTINVTTGPVMEFDGQRYVTIPDMERAMRLTAEGVIGRLRTPSARIALGMAR